MIVWIIKDGENLPIQARARKMRMWLLAEELLGRGHRVVWWTSTFFHPHKRLLADTTSEIDVASNFRLRLIHAGGYSRNVSFRRYFHNWLFGRRMAHAMATAELPDVIVTAFPLIQPAWYTVAFARARKIPVIVDVRDFWPETFLDFVPRLLRAPFRVALSGSFRKTRQLLEGANAVVSISQGGLSWARRMASSPKTPGYVVHLGYPEPRAVPARPLTAPLRLIYTGSFGRSYEVEQILQAARQIEDARPGACEFLLAGEGERSSALHSKYANVRSVTMTGWLNAVDLDAALARSHVGIVPGPLVPDAFPNKVFEYMAHRLAIVSCVSGELQDTVTQHQIGWTYAPADADALARVILSLVDRISDVGAAGSRARELYDTHYRSATLYSRYADIVEQTAHASTPQSSP